MHYILVLSFMFGRDITHQDKYGPMTEQQCHQRAHRAEQEFQGPIGDSRLITACAYVP